MGERKGFLPWEQNMKNQVAEPSRNLHGKTSGKQSSPSKPGSLIPNPWSSSFKSKEKDTKKLGKESSSFLSRIIEHVKMGSRKLSETVKGKFMLGARIIEEGGTDNIFKQRFGIREGEELLKASQCYLSTTAGPIAGLLFTSTDKVGFFSERPITITSPTGQSIRTDYKVSIPIRKIKRAYQSKNVNKPAEKYIEIVTKDGYEFWFMGFLQYEKAFDYLQKALSLASSTLSSDCRRGRLLFPAIR